jgi:anti-sigma regulatory factor (Ser/Thr protein kinase)
MDSMLEISERYPAAAASVPLARQALARLASRAGASEEQVEAVRLASSEALTNVVQHAYGGGEGWIHVASAVTDDELWVLIADDGNGMRTRIRNRGLGFGLAMIACVTDTFSLLKRSSGGTEMQMRFGLKSRKAPRAGQRRGSVSSARFAA